MRRKRYTEEQIIGILKEHEDAISTIDNWQRHYNHVRRHRSLGKKPPAVFAKEAA